MVAKFGNWQVRKKQKRFKSCSILWLLKQPSACNSFPKNRSYRYLQPQLKNGLGHRKPLAERK